MTLKEVSDDWSRRVVFATHEPGKSHPPRILSHPFSSSRRPIPAVESTPLILIPTGSPDSETGRAASTGTRRQTPLTNRRR